MLLYRTRQKTCITETWRQRRRRRRRRPPVLGNWIGTYFRVLLCAVCVCRGSAMKTMRDFFTTGVENADKSKTNAIDLISPTDIVYASSSRHRAVQHRGRRFFDSERRRLYTQLYT